MIHKNILLTIFCFINIAFLFSCENLLLTTTLKVHVPTIPSEYVSKMQKYWIIYYIGEKEIVEHTTVSIGGNVTIDLYKMQNMPIIACLKYEGIAKQTQRNIEDTLFSCSLLAGAIAPYDIHENNITLDFTSKSQTAELMLFLYSRNISTIFLNDRKFLSIIEKKSLYKPVDKLKIVQDIANNTLSYWSVKPKKSIVISFPSHTIKLMSTSLWIPHINPNVQKISLYYPGIWYFIDEQKSIFHYIAISLQGNVLSNLPIPLLKIKKQKINK